MMAGYLENRWGLPVSSSVCRVAWLLGLFACLRVAERAAR